MSDKKAKYEVQLAWQVEKIIEVAITLGAGLRSGASTGERIATAFVLNRMDLLPDCYNDVMDAWDRLDEEWQGYTREVRNKHQDYIEEKITEITGELPF